MGISKQRTFKCVGCGKTKTGHINPRTKYCSHPCYLQNGHRKYANVQELRQGYKKASADRRRRAISRAVKENTVLAKTCNDCGQTKAMRSFDHNRPDSSGWNGLCIVCNRVVAKNRAANKRAWFKRYKDQQSCLVCCENRNPCLDFHHKDPKEKEFSIGTAAGTVSLLRLKKELEKCICVCKNCHALIHARQADVTPEIIRRMQIEVRVA